MSINPPGHPTVRIAAILCRYLRLLMSVTDDGFAPRPGGGYTTPNGQEVPHDEANKPWYDIRGDTKKELLVSPLSVDLGTLTMSVSH
jgi:hypothetical protein